MMPKILKLNIQMYKELITKKIADKPKIVLAAYKALNDRNKILFVAALREICPTVVSTGKELGLPSNTLMKKYLLEAHRLQTRVIHGVDASHLIEKLLIHKDIIARSYYPKSKSDFNRDAFIAWLELGAGEIYQNKMQIIHQELKVLLNDKSLLDKFTKAMVGDQCFHFGLSRSLITGDVAPLLEIFESNHSIFEYFYHLFPDENGFIESVFLSFYKRNELKMTLTEERNDNQKYITNTKEATMEMRQLVQISGAGRTLLDAFSFFSQGNLEIRGRETDASIRALKEVLGSFYKA